MMIAPLVHMLTYYFATQLSKRFISFYFKLSSLVCLSGTIIVLGYVVTENVWLIILQQALSGLFYSVYLAQNN